MREELDYVREAKHAALYARAIERCGPTPTLLEWDDHIPSFDEVHAEAKKAEKYLHHHADALAEASR